MSRTRESPDLRRRPIHNEPPPRSIPRSPNKSSDENLTDESVDETGDISKVDDQNKGIGQKRLYPDLNKFETEQAKFVVEIDEHGTRAAGEYKRTHIETRGERVVDSADSVNVPTTSESFNFAKILCIVLVLVIIAAVLFNMVEEPVRPTPRVTEIVNKLRKEYENQPNLSFRIIKKALESVLALRNISEPSAPAVLLLMSTKGAKRETDSFAKHLAELVASGNGNYQTIYGNQLQAEDPDEAKKEIDDLIKGAPKYNSQIVVLIRDLDVIPSKAVMMLHAYCDHENAPFKNAVFIMTISTDADLNNCESRYFDEAAESHLTKMWGDLSKDMLSALFSRITVSVAAIYHKTKPAFCK